MNSTYDTEFLNFIAKHGKQYKSKEEFKLRSRLFKTAARAIELENAKPENTFRLAVNKFADWTPEEYRSLLGLKN